MRIYLIFVKNEKETQCEVLLITSVLTPTSIHFRMCTVSSQIDVL